MIAKKEFIRDVYNLLIKSREFEYNKIHYISDYFKINYVSDNFERPFDHVFYYGENIRIIINDDYSSMYFRDFSNYEFVDCGDVIDKLPSEIRQLFLFNIEFLS